MKGKPFTLLALAGILAVAACAAPQSTETRQGAADSPGERGTPKRITAAVLGDHPSVISKFERALPGAESIEFLVAAGLTVADDQGGLSPVLAEQVPTTENGLWKVLPNGEMEISWTLKPNLKSHDGQPVTTSDLLSLQPGSPLVGCQVAPSVTRATSRQSRRQGRLGADPSLRSE